MESIEKLRDYANEQIINGPLMNAMIDEIEREIDEKYVIRPTGLDGLPIYEGDVLETVYGERTEVTDVMATVWSYGVRISPSNHRHVTDNDPVKELLRQYRNELEELIQGGFGNVDSLTDDFAARIREAVEK